LWTNASSNNVTASFSIFTWKQDNDGLLTTDETRSKLFPCYGFQSAQHAALQAIESILVYNTNTKTIIYTRFKHIAELINENIWKNAQLLAKQPFAEILRRIGTLISPGHKIVHLPSKTSNYSKEFKTQLISYLGPNAILVIRSNISLSQTCLPIQTRSSTQTTPIIPPMDANEQRNAIRFNTRTPQNHPGKSGEKIRSNKQANPTRPWEPTNEYNNKASASFPRNKSATNKTKEFSIKLQTLSFFTREKMAKQKKRLCFRPSTSTSSTATKQINANTKSHHQSTM
jgi:hypothetical protein